MKSLYLPVILSLLCTGCIIIPIPTPEHSPDYTSRALIGKESLGFLEVGSTTIEEVFLNLGEPDHTQDHQRIFKYMWKTESALSLFDLSIEGGGVSKWTYYKIYQLLIEFDDIGIVKGFEIKEEKKPTKREDYKQWF